MATVDTLPSAASIPARAPGAKQPSIWNILDVILLGLVNLFSIYFVNVCFVVLLVGLTAVTLDSFLRSGLMGLSADFPWIYQAYNLLTTASQAAIGLGAIAAAARFHGKFAGLKERFARLSPRQVLAWITAGIVLAPVTGLAGMGILWLQGKPFENPQLFFLLPPGSGWAYQISSLLLVGFLAPLAEESFYRGVVFDWARGKLPVWLAILLTSLLFGAAHLNLMVGAAAVLLGIATAWAYARTGSLWSAVLLHAAHNTFKLALIYLTTQ